MEYIRIEGIIGLVIVVGILLAIVAMGPSFSPAPTTTTATQTQTSKFKVTKAVLYSDGSNYIINATIEASGISGYGKLYQVILNGTKYYAFYKQGNDGQVVQYKSGTNNYLIFLSTSNTTYSPPTSLPYGKYVATFVSQQGNSTITITFGSPQK